jgi:hypothetical protein
MASFQELAARVHNITTVVESADAVWAGIRERLISLRDAPAAADIDALIAELDAAANTLSASIANTPGTPAAPAPAAALETDPPEVEAFAGEPAAQPEASGPGSTAETSIGGDPAAT